MSWIWLEAWFLTSLLTISVQAATETFRIDAPVLGARSESLWVIDSSRTSSDSAEALTRDFAYFLSSIRTAKINHTIIVLSGNAGMWGGMPIHRVGETMAIASDDPEAESKFSDRVRLASVTRSARDNWPSSLLWSAILFFGRLADNADLKTEFWTKDVPLEMMLVSEGPDAFSAYQRHYSGWENATVENYAETFLATAGSAEKSLRISAIAPGMKRRVPASQNPYRLLATRSHGIRYSSDNCHFDMAEALHDYARQVIFRSYVHAKSHLKLAAIPKGAVHVSVGSYDVSEQLWDYDSSTNAVDLHWYLLEQGQWKPGDHIKVEY